MPTCRPPALEFGGNSAAKHTVTYFRTSFQVTDPGSISDLTLRHLRDDGTVTYLNGVEVLRSNMPGGALTTTTYSATTVDGAAERQIYTDVIPSTGLVAGTNVLAVQLHQRPASSSDIGLKLGPAAEQDTIGVPGHQPAFARRRHRLGGRHRRGHRLPSAARRLRAVGRRRTRLRGRCTSVRRRSGEWVSRRRSVGRARPPPERQRPPAG